ncbi:P-loop containing nucleoside triphosphate hydrolase protein [Amylostereum chailletii]|nr:P-loop containing nucleoside triphosphate hydrolase protein [Amylostereum chailletii]
MVSTFPTLEPLSYPVTASSSNPALAESQPPSPPVFSIQTPRDASPSPQETESAEVTARAQSHERERKRCSELLEEARKRAAPKYVSAEARKKMSEECKARSHGKIVPHEWQLDIAECLILGVDCELIAATGTGKTITFALPLFYDPKKTIVVISPLNALEVDQEQRFRDLGLRAKAVNGETYTEQVRKSIQRGHFQIIITSPEMCLRHSGFRSLLDDPTHALAKRLVAVIIDEAHCITQWGDKFRTIFTELGTLRAFASGVPFLVTSATLTPSDLVEIRKLTHSQRLNSYHLNLGNDRPNICWNVLDMKAGKSDLDALSFLLPSTENGTSLQRGIIFFDDIIVSMYAKRWFQDHLPPALQGRVACFNSRRGAGTKTRIMTRLKSKDIDILFASEAAGMGCDVAALDFTVQFMVPSSLSVWLQRAGRAGRGQDCKANAYLLIQPSVFQEKGKNTRLEDEDVKYVKEIDDGLRLWIEAPSCRRNVADEHFNNPPERNGALFVLCWCVDGSVE